MIEKIIYFTKQLKRKWILWRTGYSNWEMYLRITDPDIYQTSHCISDFYHGYPYVYCFENKNHRVYHWELGREVHNWCKVQCKDKFRFDSHRVSKRAGFYIKVNSSGEWYFDEFSGGDYVFAAFKNREDYTWFKLRWA